MSIKHLDKLFKPSSVAVVGASNKANRPGNVVMKNLLQGEFAGPIMPVTFKYTAVNGVLAYKTIADLPMVPDLAIVCTRAQRVPEILTALGDKGCQNVIVIAAGLGVTPAETSDTEGFETLQDQILTIAKPYGMRILGPNSIGLMVPGLGLNASYAHVDALPGKIAFVSQSSAVCATILDWANPRGIGFSNVVALGDSADIDFGELIDYLGRDVKTRAILLYIESIEQGRQFMSAARATSITKPILVIKAGRNREGVTGAMHLTDDASNNDNVYDAAFKRAGMLRVDDLRELFAAVETLAYGKPVIGERLVMLTNGIGPSMMALDTLIETGGRLASLDAVTTEKLQAIIPNGGSVTNPVNLLGDAQPELYQQALDILLDAGGVDNILVMHSPSALTNSSAYADKVIHTIKRHTGKIPNILVNWMGEQASQTARQHFARAGIPSFRTPEGAVGAFMHMVQYRRNQKLLQETPESVSDDSEQQSELAARLIQQAISNGLEQFDTYHAKELLAAYKLDSIPARMAYTSTQAAQLAESLGYPLAVKLISNDIRKKSDVMGVMLNLATQEDVHNACDGMLSRAYEAYPEADIEGFLLQSMARRAGSHQLRLTVRNNPVFGPILFLGEGGSSRNIQRDSVAALPPLNMALSRYLIIQALAEGKLRDRHLPIPIDRQALSLTLTRVSQMIVDNPEICEVDMTLLTAPKLMQVLEVSMLLSADTDSRQLAIRPYPKHLEEIFTLRSQRQVTLRPIRPEDEATHQAFDQSLSKEDRYKRYFGEVATFSHEQMARLTQIDYDREMAFIATAVDVDGKPETLGVVRAQMDPDNYEAEFAIIIRSDMKGEGLGKRLLEKVIEHCRAHGTEVLSGITMLQNRGMATLARKLGFEVKTDMEEGMIEMRLELKH
jgi:acetyltransferase